MVKKKTINKTESKVVLTTFLLIFPSMILTGIATANSSIGYAAVALSLWFYQAILIQNYVKSNVLN